MPWATQDPSRSRRALKVLLMVRQRAADVGTDDAAGDAVVMAVKESWQ